VCSSELVLFDLFIFRIGQYHLAHLLQRVLPVLFILLSVADNVDTGIDRCQERGGVRLVLAGDIEGCAMVG